MCVAQLVNAKNWDENETISLTQRLNFMEIDKQNILTLQVWGSNRSAMRACFARAVRGNYSSVIARASSTISSVLLET